MSFFLKPRFAGRQGRVALIAYDQTVLALSWRLEKLSISRYSTLSITCFSGLNGRLNVKETLCCFASLRLSDLSPEASSIEGGLSSFFQWETLVRGE